jgi:hypothetical protein
MIVPTASVVSVRRKEAFSMTECSETLFPFEAHFSRQVVAKKEQQRTGQPARVFTEFFYQTLPSRPGRRLKRGDYVQKATGTGVRAINTKKRQVKKASDKKSGRNTVRIALRTYPS